MIGFSSRVQVLADDAHQEDRNDVGENDCVDTSCRAQPNILTFQHTLEDQIRQRLGSEGTACGDEDLGEDRQQERSSGSARQS